MRDDHIGARIATQRKLRSLTQTQLATRARFSPSLVRAVEQGRRPATPDFIAGAAKAMRIDRAVLLGQPYQSDDPNDGELLSGISELRREVAAHGLPPMDDGTVATDLDQRVAIASHLQSNSRYGALGGMLPGLLAELRRASFESAGVTHDRIMGWTAEAYDAGRQLAWKLGYLDLAHELAVLYRQAAAESGDPLAAAVGESMRVHDLISTADYPLAKYTVDRAIGRVGALPTSERQLAVYGYLHLEAALVAARSGDESGVRTHYAEATATADRLGRDSSAYRLSFGPTNVGIWGVSLAVETLDGRSAVRQAEQVRLGPTTPAERAGHHWIDVARGYLLVGSTGEALESMWKARRVAPEHTRSHPMAKEAVYGLARAERRASDSLRGLANWIGIED